MNTKNLTLFNHPSCSKRLTTLFLSMFLTLNSSFKVLANCFALFQISSSAISFLSILLQERLVMGSCLLLFFLFYFLRFDIPQCSQSHFLPGACLAISHSSIFLCHTLPRFRLFFYCTSVLISSFRGFQRSRPLRRRAPIVLILHTAAAGTLLQLRDQMVRGAEVGKYYARYYGFRKSLSLNKNRFVNFWSDKDQHEEIEPSQSTGQETT